jgi:hypothetical protein
VAGREPHRQRGAAGPEFPAAASLAASTLLPAAAGQRAVVTILGTQALLCYRLDRPEDTRRRRARLGAIRDLKILDLLLGLPLGAAVPVTSLTPPERSALRSTPSGVLAVAAGAVTRHAVTPLTVDLAVVTAHGWRSGLPIAGRFAPFCVRVLLLPRCPSDPEHLSLQAGFYGIGVVVADHAENLQVLVTPRPFRRQRFTAAGWLFTEEVYQQVR